MDSLNLATLSIDIVANGVDQAQAKIETLDKSIQKTADTSKTSTSSANKSFSGFTDKLKATISQQKICGTTVGQLADKFKSVSGATDLASLGVTALKGACIALAVEGIQKLAEAIDQVASAGDTIDKMSQKIGVSASEYQQWESILGHNGTTISTYSMAIKTMNSSLDENAEKYKQLGVSLTNVDGSAKSTNDVFYETILALSDMSDTTERNKLAQELLGRSYQELLPLLNSGSDSIRQQMEASKEAIIYTDEYVKASANLTDANQRMSEQMSGTKVALVGGLLDPLADIKNEFASVIEKMRPLLSLIGELAGGILQNVADGFKIAGKAIELFLDAINEIVEPLNDLLDMIKEDTKPIRDAWDDMFDSIGEGAEDTAQQAKDAFTEATDDITKSAYDASEAYDKIVTDRIKDETKKYREQLEEQYGDSLHAQMKIEEKVAEYTEKRKKHYEDIKHCYVKTEDAMADATDKTLSNADTKVDKTVKKVKTLLNALSSVTKLLPGGGVISDIEKYAANHYATGTAYHAGGYAIVGENGRELVELGRGAKVYNNRQTENILNSSKTGNTTNNFNIAIDASNVREFNDIIEICNGYKQSTRMGY